MIPLPHRREKSERKPRRSPFIIDGRSDSSVGRNYEDYFGSWNGAGHLLWAGCHQHGGGPPIGDGPATGTSLSADSVALDAAGNIYTSDNNNRIRKIGTDGRVTTIAGGVLGYSGDGGPAKNAALSFPSGIALDAAGNLYFADKGNSRIRKIDPAGIITTVAGTGTTGFSGDGGPATRAQIGRSAAVLAGVAVDRAGNLYLADPGNNRIRVVNSAGIIS